MGTGRRAYGWRPPSALATVRVLGTGLLVLAFLFQNYIAERHVHAIGAAAAGAAQARTNVDAFAKPFVPTSDQHDDDCPLCQVLSLGASTDISHGIFVAEPMPTVDGLVAMAGDATPLDTSLTAHRPRGPPTSFSTI
jgi:hypothetical protein